ncbi:hypothetical protein ACRRTK_004872 [Alexandromys fortis]
MPFHRTVSTQRVERHLCGTGSHPRSHPGNCKKMGEAVPSSFLHNDRHFVVFSIHTPFQTTPSSYYAISFKC